MVVASIPPAYVPLPTDLGRMRGFHMSTVRITYFGMEGTGRNVTEAKRDAGSKLEAAMRGSYNPVLMSHRGWSILVWRTPSGWESTITHEPGEFGHVRKEGTLYGGSYGDKTREEVIDYAKEHLAQVSWLPEDGLVPPAFLVKRQSVSDFKTWAEFQMRYKAARERGMDDNDAHSYAGRNPGRAELWAHEAA